MALYRCYTTDPLSTKLEWDVQAWGTVCTSILKSIKIKDETSTVLHFQMLDDNGETHECYVWGKKGTNLAPYLTKDTRVIITGKALSENPHSIRVQWVEFK